MVDLSKYNKVIKVFVWSLKAQFVWLELFNYKFSLIYLFVADIWKEGSMDSELGERNGNSNHKLRTKPTNCRKWFDQIIVRSKRPTSNSNGNWCNYNRYKQQTQMKTADQAIGTLPSYLTEAHILAAIKLKKKNNNNKLNRIYSDVSSNV